MHDLLREAYAAMKHNRRRTALTMLGMAWGIATVVMLLAYGDGFGQACANIFANFGTKLMILVPNRTSMQAGGEKAGVKVRFTLEDVDTLIPIFPRSATSRPKPASRPTFNTTLGLTLSSSAANTRTHFPSAPSPWTRDASITSKTRCSALTSSCSVPRPKRNYFPAVTRCTSGFALTASALK